MDQSEYEGDGHKMFPGPTAGSGRIDPGISSSRGQGAGAPDRKVPCKQCGMKVDMSRVVRGGTYSGDGGLGPISLTQQTGTLLGGGTVTENLGDQNVPAGSGCPLCGTQNFAE